MKPIANLSVLMLKKLKEKLDTAATQENLDDYSKAHLEDALQRVTKWLDSQYVYNTNESGGGGGITFIFGKEAGQQE